jgi:hypothetical protein
MVSRKHKFIIVTPPKTGSVSLTFALLDYIKYRRIVKQRPDCFDYSDDFGKYSKHATLRAIQAKWNRKVYGKLQDYHLVGTVRNPWDRMVSWWSWENTECLFEDFITQPTKFRAKQLVRDYFTTRKGNVIDTFIRFENMQGDFDEFCGRVGIPKQELPHKNKTKKRRHYSEYYDDALRDVVASQHAADIEHFGYEFEG